MTEQAQVQSVQPSQEQDHDVKPEPQYVPVDDRPVPIEQYTPEQVAAASQELQELTPEDLLNIKGEIDSLNRVIEFDNFPEARAIIFAEFVEPGGGKFNATVRANTLIDAWDEMAVATRYANKQFGIAMNRPQPYRPPAQANAPITPPTTPQAAPVAPSPSASSTKSDSGTDVLNKIQIDADGKIKFSVGKFRYPFTDGRGPAVVAGLFDESTGFSETHFEKPSIYEPMQWGNGVLLVDWVKEGKYYNIKRIYPQN